MSITRERWQQVKAIALEAWRLPPTDRGAYATAACGADAALLREVESLLTSMGAAGDRFETPSLRIPAASDTLLHDIAEAPPAAPASARVGGWHILRPLGRGGMGTVYLAERA